MDYRVELDIFNGPLDLLLYLIKRDELDIYDIPIAKITDSYLAYLNMLREMKTAGGLDINVAGDFLVMAATLMEIKSAMLLPHAPASQAEGETSAAEQLSDPRYELVQKLLEYKRFKDSANLLEHQQTQHSQRFPRFPVRPGFDPDEPPPVDLDEVQIWDLMTAFNRLMKEVGIRKPREHEVVYDDTPIDLHAADIEDRLKREGRLTLRDLVVGRKSKSEMVGVFLALLELIRQKKILVHQAETLGEVEILPAPPEHRASIDLPPLHLAPASIEPNYRTEGPASPESATPTPSSPAPDATVGATPDLGERSRTDLGERSRTNLGERSRTVSPSALPPSPDEPVGAALRGRPSPPSPATPPSPGTPGEGKGGGLGSEEGRGEGLESAPPSNDPSNP